MSDAMRKWVENWKRVGPILERIEAEELRTMDGRNATREIIEMCDWCCDHSKPSDTSGLIEQQRWFAVMKKRLEERIA